MEDRKEKIENLLSKNIEEVYVKKELEKVLLSDKKVRIYIGVDPSSPVIHIGHAVGLWKLREFQDLGHKVIFLIGDFTGRIGDPTDRSAQRVQLTSEEVRKNAETYVEQAGKILDIKNKKNPIEIRYNGEWHDKMAFKDT
ncbi:tyrosine--tRNA ligase, partial [Patescibacteria group bacterium]|nr:tyrosine--tRNA ligase [Patescibacteria group bacterium]